MPRTARLCIPNIPHHVVQRGHDRAPCFITERNLELYLGLLGEYAPKNACEIHAYVLMPNHVHLLLTPRTGDGCTRVMREVHQRYSQWMNRTMGRIGTLWQGRFWSSPVDTASYFFACQRYIELNPVRAGLVGDAKNYRWSSHRSNAWGEASILLAPHEKYLDLGGDPRARQAVYRDFFTRELEDFELQAIRAAIRGGLPLGSEQFVDEMERLTGRRLRRRRPGRRRTAGDDRASNDEEAGFDRRIRGASPV